MSRTKTPVMVYVQKIRFQEAWQAE